MEWILNKVDSLPPKNQRILVSDGEVIVIAQLVDSYWIFDNSGLKDMEVIWWATLLSMPPQIKSI